MNNSPILIQEFKAASLNVAPPLFLAPLAGVTHSAFRRLIADFGGYGALFTEMLSATALKGEDLHGSPYTKRRASEGKVVYQLRINAEEPLELIIPRLKTIQADAIDINLGCPAPAIKRRKSGCALFEDTKDLHSLLANCRQLWDGPLSVKCRLGDGKDGWEKRFEEKLRIFEECKIDAITVHPRFSNEKLKRNARWHLFPWITALTHIPVIANGDICSPKDVKTLLGESGCKAVMIGRMAVIRPWIFAQISGLKCNVDHHQVWDTYCDYTLEDFPAEKAIGRIKQFCYYFSRNFLFGHQFYSAVQSSSNLDTLFSRANAFLSNTPQLCASPSLSTT
ncbi:tRNA-dihydrouridine synthase family protein [Chitinispirillales bacterium ANBcel5]|uniref:tRNA dihydrouridine synthase n=1 Tax=Cellulosispirillum alkaliphilum TaxID=3039283 RepID=UPI002A50CA6A|nr:tRNA-dihydrouridine synthase family protein [Chitinispirillales bacterium ANBcel5]